MKTLILMAVTMLAGVTVFSQDTESIYTRYLLVKDALVKSDSKNAASHATSLQNEINDAAAFEGKEALLKAAQKIAATNDIEKQRTAFAETSLLMWQLVKSGDELLSDVYYQYCPMKKTYWLSSEAAIRNPYYGSKMLTCGNVADKKLRKQ